MSESKPSGKLEQLQKTIDRRIRCEERITFDTPNKERCGGVLRNVSISGCLLITIEQIKVNTEVLLYVTLVIGTETMECSVAGRIVRVDRTAAKPLLAYGVAFHESNPEIVRNALKELVTAQAAVVPPGSATPTSRIGDTPRVAPARPAPPAKEERPVQPSPMSQSAAGQESSNLRFLGQLFLGVLAVGFLYVGILYLVNRHQISQFSGSIPLEHVSVEGRDVLAKVKDEWFKITPRPDQEKALYKYGEILIHERLNSMQFYDSRDKMVALVAVQFGGDGHNISVRILQ